MRAAAVSVAAVTFTDRTCLQVTGLTWRQARAFALAHGVPIARAGRRAVVRVDRWLEALDRAANVEVRPAWSEADVIARAATGGRR